MSQPAPGTQSEVSGMGNIEQSEDALKADLEANYWRDRCEDARMRAAKWEQTANEERARADRAEQQLKGAVDALLKIADPSMRLPGTMRRTAVEALEKLGVDPNTAGGQ